jgi:DNA-binding NarL/FixJ family response regulator
MASNGKEAVDLVREHSPDVVVLDLQMPVMDGSCAAQHIKHVCPEVKIVFYSSLEGSSLDSMLQDTSFDAICDKATGTQELVELVMQLGETSCVRQYPA